MYYRYITFPHQMDGFYYDTSLLICLLYIIYNRQKTTKKL